MSNSVIDAGGRDAAHPVAEMLREPEVAVGPGRDDSRRAAGMRQIEFDDARAVLRHAADAVAGRSR